MTMPQQPRKLRRVTQACDFCHKRSIKCSPSQEDTRRCQNCVDFALQCTYDRPTKRRGVRRKSVTGNGQVASPTSTYIGGPSHHRTHEPSGGPGVSPIYSQETDDDISTTGSRWTARVVASPFIVQGLVDIYFEVVYPIFPFFHQPTLLRKVRNGEHNRDRSLFAAVMAVCALASARARDGALFSGRYEASLFKEPPSEAFFAAARDVIPKDLTQGKTFDYLRACGVLAITGIQYGDIDVMQQYLGYVHTFVNMRRLYDENNWDRGLTVVGIEERRRFYWSAYTLEIYASIIWGGMIRCREAHTRVRYPTEIEDEFISDIGYDEAGAAASQVNRQPGLDGTRPACWLHGWNFTTDLYRILEHATDQFRTKRLQNRPLTSVANIFGERIQPQKKALDYVGEMLARLPQRFKEFSTVHVDPVRNRYDFQAANITATVQLVHMLLFEPDDAEVEQKCNVASELLHVFLTIPVPYLRAISAPLMHHLAGIGSLLGSVIERPISDHLYQRVRSILIEMAGLLENIETQLHRVASTSGTPSEGLKMHVARIDEYMANHRRTAGYSSQSQSVDQAKIEELTTQNLALRDAQFQLPDELLQNWPWPFYVPYAPHAPDLLPLQFQWDGMA